MGVLTRHYWSPLYSHTHAHGVFAPENRDVLAEPQKTVTPHLAFLEKDLALGVVLQLFRRGRGDSSGVIDHERNQLGQLPAAENNGPQDSLLGRLLVVFLPISRSQQFQIILAVPELDEAQSGFILDGERGEESTGLSRAQRREKNEGEDQVKDDQAEETERAGAHVCPAEHFGCNRQKNYDVAPGIRQQQ